MWKMIFKSVLKYKIFEWCLDTFCDKIIKNFTKNPQIRRKFPQIGEYFSEIIDIEDFAKYYECIICEYVIYSGVEEISVDIIPDDVSENDIGIGFAFAYDLHDNEKIEDFKDIHPEDLAGEVIGPIIDFVFTK